MAVLLIRQGRAFAESGGRPFDSAMNIFFRKEIEMETLKQSKNLQEREFEISKLYLYEWQCHYDCNSPYICKQCRQRVPETYVYWSGEYARHRRCNNLLRRKE